ncbi:MAG TPA: SAM-dependent methyltransferase [Anaeromyxobacteraceae bacterium]|nr:SAM-dependent methyltransferase [Anaeromyxobacteraceae bacterium]
MPRSSLPVRPSMAIALAVLAGCATPRPLDYRALVAAPDRLEADRALDAGRRPAEMLSFLAVRPGGRVAELGAGAGYTTELLARAVAPDGVVYAQNSAFLLGLVNEPWTKRLARPSMRDVVRLDREFDDPLPPEAKGLDLVVMNAVYHDTVWMKVDRARMNRAVFEALASGGAFVVIDSSARPGSGLSDVATLHRIDEAAVREEVERAGFRLVATGSFLRNPADARDWNSSPRAAGERRGTSDRFALKFVKP